ncbi:MAG: hypothetical protein ABEJ30_02330 [Halorientalis sp.]
MYTTAVWGIPVKEHVSRRDVVTGSLTIGATALAGCSSVTNLISGGGGQGYTDWMATPSALEQGESYPFVQVDASTFTEHPDLVDDFFYQKVVETIAGSFWGTEIEAEDVDTFVDLRLAGAAETGLEDKDLIDPLEENEDFEEAGTYGGYTIFEETDADSAYGISGGDMAYGALPVLGGGNARDRLEAVIAAKKGSTARYPEKSERIDMLIDELGDQTFLAGWPHPERFDNKPNEGTFDGQIARGWGLVFADDGATATFTRILTSDASVSKSAAEEWVEKGERVGPIEDPNISIDGRIVTVSGPVDATKYTDFFG